MGKGMTGGEEGMREGFRRSAAIEKQPISFGWLLGGRSTGLSPSFLY
jgi:hypothetical protein